MKQKSKYLYFLGIDISKDTLDCTLAKGAEPLFHRKIQNQPSDIRQLLEDILSLKGITRRNIVTGMENMGFYANPLIETLVRLRVKYTSEHALNIKRSLGMVRGKSDKMDSERIALHLYKTRDLLSPSHPRRPEIETLAMLATMRERMVKMELKLRNPLRQSQGFIPKPMQDSARLLCSASIESVRRDIRSIEAQIRRTWTEDNALNRLMELILSVPGVGEVTGVQLLITTNEFRAITEAKKFACYCGVAPFPYSSGTALDKGSRTSKMCNRRMKALIGACAVSASRYIPEIRDYYQRKQAEGKHKMSVLNAIGFKVISRIFTCIKQDRPYEKEYQCCIAQVKIDAQHAPNSANISTGDQVAALADSGNK